MSLHQQTRLLAPTTYDASKRTVTAVLSKGSPVKRSYGTEILKISPEAVILTRINNGGIPLLDSHSQFGVLVSLGSVTSAWVTGGELRGTLKFHDTDEGRKAEGMVARGEITGISCGYRVEEWEIKDKDGRVIDPEVDRIRFDDDLTFTATRWELLEASLVTVPADSMASVRYHADCAVPAAVFEVADARARMQAHERMYNRAEAAAALSRMTSRQDRYDFAQAALARMAARERMHARAQDV